MKLRDYQEQCLTEWWARMGAGDVRVPFVLATGLGKTQIFTSGADRWLAENPGRRVLIIAHTDELIEQAAKRARQISPSRRIGVVKAAQDDVLAEIVISSRQTLASKARRDRLRNVGLIIIDEAHHAVRTNTYGKILEHFGAFDDPSPVSVAGFTATLARSDKAKLSSVWQECTFTRDILFGIRRGYLLDVRGERIVVPDLDLSKVRVSRGDYVDSDVAEELERTFAPEVIAQKYAELASTRRGIAFWPLVATAHHGAKAFNDVGIRSGVVSGETPKVERRELLQRFHLPLAHDEAIDVMHNAMVLTEGFDEPSADVVVIARPTRSAPLYQQMVGRVLRPDLTVPAERREKALILDVTGASEDATLHSLIDLSPERKRALDEHEGDLSLLEMDEYLEAIAEELEEKRAGASFEFESDEYRGETTVKAFDPLGRDKVWGTTPSGAYFINVGHAYVFLADSVNGDPGTYDVVTCSARTSTWKDKRSGETLYPFVKGTEHQGLPLDLALGWAEDVAIALGGYGAKSLAGKTSKWRKEAPTDAQLRMAASCRIDVTGMNKGEVSQAIDAVMAARRIDPIIRAVKARFAKVED